MEASTQSRPIKRPSKDLYPDAEKIEQPSDHDLGLGETPFQRPSPSEVIVEPNPVRMEYAEELRFNEDPVTIIAHTSADPNAPLYIEGWVNGRGVERWLEGLGWCEVKFIPVGEPVTVKRKYVEQWLRGRTVGVQTVEDKADGSEPRNMLRRIVSGTHTIQIVEDRNPRGAEWARRLMRMTVAA